MKESIMQSTQFASLFFMRFPSLNPMLSINQSIPLINIKTAHELCKYFSLPEKSPPDLNPNSSLSPYHPFSYVQVPIPSHHCADVATPTSKWPVSWPPSKAFQRAEIRTAKRGGKASIPISKPREGTPGNHTH